MSFWESIERNRDQLGEKLDIIIIGLIIYSAVTIALETISGLSPGARSFLDYSRLAVTGIFTVEYVVRVIASKDRLKFVFSIYGLIDVIAIVPVYLGLGHEAQVLRAFRILHLFRMTRYETAVQRVGKAMRQSRGEATIFVVFTFVLLYLSAVGIYHFEHQAQPENFNSVLDGMWWAVATITTVGYGDIYPVTPGGRLFAGLIVLIGLGIVAVPSGLLAAAMTSVRRAEEMEANRRDANKTGESSS
ncbi:MAG: ion transporter [Rhodobacteraceae bacterium]|nr:ion transporter [Paracoccaceae bacterium]MCY4137607.1 ion transporter [Paracoccaceae bacterium]